MLDKLTNRVYALPYEEGITKPALGLIVGNKYSLVVDGGHSKEHAKEFLRGVHKLNSPSLEYLTITHWHWDHIAGADTMNLTNIINYKTKKNLQQVKELIKSEKELDVDKLGKVMYGTTLKLKELVDDGLKILNGDIVFKEKIEVDLGGLICVIENIGGDHSLDSNLVYVEDEKVMFLGDSIYRDLDKTHKCYHIEVMKPLIEKIMKYDTDYYLTAHKPVYTKEEMKIHFESMIDIGEFVGVRMDLKQLTLDYGETKGRRTTAEERFLIGSFVNGNKNKL